MTICETCDMYTEDFRLADDGMGGLIVTCEKCDMYAEEQYYRRRN